jgi:hypothetical protein
LSKKRDALRRGIRALIHDTSQELADLEGRPRPDPPPPVTVPPAAEPAAPAPAAGPGMPEPSEASRAMWIVGPEHAVLEPPAPTLPAPAPPAPPKTAQPPAAVPLPDTRRRPPASQSAKRARGTGSSDRRKAPKGGKASRPPRRPAAEAVGNGVNPQQAHARKGVCFAYFINHECWRVPDAYCNTALQVCAIRACPVYHLHQEALERRFAGKFKHLW